ncbi:MAG: DUF4177 domain-containing protein [Firmicutes bacterium]|nr:DUF4177 domain-containing protein [Bacillota bacterium]
MAYEYKMVQVSPNVIASRRQTGTEAADYLQGIVNAHAAEGWEFQRIDTLGIVVPPGCLSTRGPQVTQYYVITFRREASRGA